jgi:hypothetical protein
MLHRVCHCSVSWCLQEGRERDKLLGAGDWELPATRHGLDDDVGFFYASGEELGLSASKERLDYGCRRGALACVF